MRIDVTYKRQTRILGFLLTLLVLSCGQNTHETKLIGTWYSVENNGYTRLQFYKDSLIVRELDEKVTNWKASKSKIEFPLKMLSSDSAGIPKLSTEDVTIDYTLSEHNDTLFGTFKSGNGTSDAVLLKAENYSNFLRKRYQLKFSLPEDDSAVLLKTEPVYGLKVFMGITNDSVTGRTELSNTLNQLESDIIAFKKKIQPSKLSLINTHDRLLDVRLHLRVFADKSIPDSTITEYLKATIVSDKSKINKETPERLKFKKGDTLPIRIFRIYQSEEQLNLGALNGKRIKSNARTIYN